MICTIGITLKTDVLKIKKNLIFTDKHEWSFGKISDIVTFLKQATVIGSSWFHIAYMIS